jgi:hypothetical protein
MRKFMLSAICAGFALCLQSCIVMTSTSIANVKPSSGRQVSASAGAMGFLRLTAPRQIAKKATEDLKQQGATSNISTTLTMREWFGIVQYYRVVATGQAEK